VGQFETDPLPEIPGVSDIKLSEVYNNLEGIFAATKDLDFVERVLKQNTLNNGRER
jgi:hypothetical protein